MSEAGVLAPAGDPAFVAAQSAWVLIAGAAVVFAIVVGLLAYAVVAGRRGRAVDARRWLIGGGIAFPVVGLALLLAHELLADEAPIDGGALAVSVSGRAWWWQVRYRDPASGGDVVLANELHLPLDRAATIGVNSDDVIHSVWIPALAGKVDAVPGRVQQLRVRARAAGTYRAPCAEFCGEQHAQMTLVVVVEPADAFARWLAAQAAPAAEPTSALARRGREVFAQQRCDACHVVRGLFPLPALPAPAALVAASASAGRAAPGAGALGGSAAASVDPPLDRGVPTADVIAAPDLTHVGSRRFIGAGVLAADAEGFARWLVGVQHLKRGARMPQYDRLDAGSLAALSAFLAELR